VANDFKGDFVGAVACFAAGAFVYFDLAALESGSESIVKVWAPLAYLYNHFGFTAAVSCLPALGVLFFGLGLFKYFKSKPGASA
jgi:hypothetical protein